MAVGKMCDCQFGALTFDDITTTKKTSKRSVTANDLFSKRGDSDDVYNCHDSKCIRGGGFTLKKGKCVGDLSPPDMSNDPGRRGAPPALGCKNRSDFPSIISQIKDKVKDVIGDIIDFFG